jgi:DNA primase
MAQPGDFAYTVKQQADIVRVVGDYVTLKKSGAQNWTGLCPFHKEKTGSFSVHASRQFFHCFGCHESGDVFAFVQKIENITFPEAVRTVAQKLGIPLPKIEYSSPEEARQARQRGALLDINERACAWFEEQLRKPEAAGAREYLKARGLNDESVKRFRIGYAPDHGFALRDVVKGQFDDEVMRASGLFSWKENTGSFDSRRAAPEAGAKYAPLAQDDKREGSSAIALYSKFRNRITFPICNEQGRVIAFTGRTLSQDEKAGPKYLNSPETAIYSKSHVLFNLDKAKDAIRKMEYAILVEGQMDCISVSAAGIPNVIASSGTAFTEPQARLLARFSRNIIVNFDPDTAGAAAAERSLGLLVEEDFQIRVLTLDAGFDPDLFIRNKGREAYIAAMRAAPKYFDYLISRAQTQFPVRTPEGKVKAINFLLPHVQRVQSRIVRDELAGNIAQRLGIDSAVLRQELKSAATNRSAARVSAPAATQVTTAERVVIRSLMSSAPDDLGFDPAPLVRAALKNEDLHVGLSTERAIESLLASNGDPTAVNDGDDRKLVAEILMHDESPLTAEVVEGALTALRRRILQRRVHDLNGKLQTAKRANDADAVDQLRREKVQLDRELRSMLVCASGTDVERSL